MGDFENSHAKFEHIKEQLRRLILSKYVKPENQMNDKTFTIKALLLMIENRISDQCELEIDEDCRYVLILARSGICDAINYIDEYRLLKGVD